MYLLIIYIPETHVERVKSALFDKGAGSYRNYNCCSWQVAGEGQFQPLEGSNPFLGKIGTIKKVPEYKVEMICNNQIMDKVIKELYRVHPYEEPAYSVIELKNDLFNR